MAGVIDELIEEATRETTERVKRETTERTIFDMAKKLIAGGKLALEEISALCDLPIEKVRELAAAKNNQTLE